MATNHTPGPWAQAHRICDEDGNYSTQVFSAETGETIATLTWAKMPSEKVVIDGKPKIKTGTYREGNAKLIAAAPEMLEVLQTIENDNNQVPQWLWDKIQTVIKKATK